MGMRKKKGGHGGGHGWFVTFADLMALLMAFFVVVAAFSSQDKEKLQVVAGSMREAFGVARDVRTAGVIEINGLPEHRHLREVSPLPSEREVPLGTDQPDPARTNARAPGDGLHTPQARANEAHFASAAATLRQAWQSMPEIAEISRHIHMEETPEGLALSLVDQDGRAMFPEASRFPYERTRQILQTIGPTLARLPHNVAIIGHTSARRITHRPGQTAWDLSSERANAVRGILVESGLPNGRIAAVTGKASAEPLLPADPQAPLNNRVTILLLPAAPPMPPRARP